MTMLVSIREKIVTRQYEFSKHALDQSIVRDITMKETMIQTKVTYTVEVDGKFYLIEHVPARVCKETGEQYFSPETVEHIQTLIKTRKKPDRTIATPVYEYA